MVAHKSQISATKSKYLCLTHFVCGGGSSVCSNPSDFFILGSRLKGMLNGKRNVNPTIVLRASAWTFLSTFLWSKTWPRPMSVEWGSTPPRGGTANPVATTGNVQSSYKEGRESLGAIITICYRLRNHQIALGGRGANRPVEMKSISTEMYKSEDGLNHKSDAAEERVRELGKSKSVFVRVQRKKTNRMCVLICRERDLF